MNCPQCGFTLEPRTIGQITGAMGKGHPKRLTAEQRAAAGRRLAVARAKRWPAKFTQGQTGNNETKGTK